MYTMDKPAFRIADDLSNLSMESRSTATRGTVILDQQTSSHPSLQVDRYSYVLSIYVHNTQSVLSTDQDLRFCNNMGL